MSIHSRVVCAWQLMATGEPALVAGSAAMLETILRHNGDALPRLYTTGAFFFALAYCGSNLLEIARLLRVSHGLGFRVSVSSLGISLCGQTWQLPTFVHPACAPMEDLLREPCSWHEHVTCALCRLSCDWRGSSCFTSGSSELCRPLSVT